MRWLLVWAILMLLTWDSRHTPSCHIQLPVRLMCVHTVRHRLSVCVSVYVWKGPSPWCPIIPNNHPIVMREMRFPLNNSRPARLADPSTSQPVMAQTPTCAHKYTLSQRRIHISTHTQPPWLGFCRGCGSGDDTVSSCHSSVLSAF